MRQPLVNGTRARDRTRAQTAAFDDRDDVVQPIPAMPPVHVRAMRIVRVVIFAGNLEIEIRRRNPAPVDTRGDEFPTVGDDAAQRALECRAVESGVDPGAH